MRSKLSVFVFLFSLACSVRHLDLGLGGRLLVDRRQQVGESVTSRRRKSSCSLAEGCLAEGRPEAPPSVLLGGGQDGFPHNPLKLDGLNTPGGHGSAVVVARVEGFSLEGMLERQQRRNEPAIPADHSPGSGGNPAGEGAEVGRGRGRLVVVVVVVVETSSGGRGSGKEVNRISGHRLEFGKHVV